MEIIKTIVEILGSIAAAILTIVLPITICSFKRENQIVKRKTKKGELIDLYGFFLIAPLLSLPIQLAAKNEIVFLKPILSFLSFAFPVEVIAILGYKTWELYKQNNPSNIKKKGLEKYKGIAIFIINIFVWIFYSFNIVFIVYLSYNGIIKEPIHWERYLSLYIAGYIILLIMYIMIGRIAIGTYKKSYANKVKINYNYNGKDLEKEISFNNFKAKTEYISFYIENDNKKYLIPWDKINDIKIYYN